MPADFSVAELVQAMDRASDEVKRDVSRLIDSAAETMVSRLQRTYPQGPTGNLRGRIFVTQPRQFSTTSTGTPVPVKRVRATAPHIHIWQEGTRERFDPTRANARRGKMPRGGRVFEAVAADERGRMLRAMQDVLDRHREI